MAEAPEEVSGTAGVIPVSIGLGDLNTANAESGVTTSFSQSFGDKNVASGKSSAGNVGLVKSISLAIIAVSAYAVYAYFANKKGGK